MVAPSEADTHHRHTHVTHPDRRHREEMAQLSRGAHGRLADDARIFRDRARQQDRDRGDELDTGNQSSGDTSHPVLRLAPDTEVPRLRASALTLQFAAVVSPVQECLALTLAAGRICRLAILSDLRNVPFHGSPASDLAGILGGRAAAHIVTAIPLKPATGIVWMYPTFAPPHRQRLAGIDAEIV